jgi:hypothetical protein
MQQRRCPDCAVTMEPVEFRVSGYQTAQVSTGESKEGLLGTLGASEWTDLTAVMCPECGLVRHYADVEA